MQALALFAVALAGIAVLLFILATVRGLVFAQLWTWFVVPFGLPSIGIAQAVGLALILSLATATRQKDDDEEGAFGKSLAYGIISPLAALLIGYIAHCWMV